MPVTSLRKTSARPPEVAKIKIKIKIKIKSKQVWWWLNVPVRCAAAVAKVAWGRDQESDLTPFL
ncbi:hypothetical protein [Pseudomonas sp. B5(2017)]|uniref:hypothetical protein n=1 Tax=Pseudomonas sp. B5(2017) TaxID=1981714 RepID=UPI00111C7FE7|nr:hypothetical protein [Pseudomonas sp. B5(2017)]